MAKSKSKKRKNKNRYIPFSLSERGVTINRVPCKACKRLFNIEDPRFEPPLMKFTTSCPFCDNRQVVYYNFATSNMSVFDNNYHLVVDALTVLEARVLCETLNQAHNAAVRKMHDKPEQGTALHAHVLNTVMEKIIMATEHVDHRLQEMNKLDAELKELQKERNRDRGTKKVSRETRERSVAVLE